MRPLIQGHALQKMLRSEVEPWDPMPTDKKEDNIITSTDKGET